MTCDDLIPFVDNELDPARADEFRLHLDTCTKCRRDVVFERALSVRLRALGDALRQRRD